MLYAEEGAILAEAGLEGAEYDFDGSGMWSVADGQDFSGRRANTLIADGGAYPGLRPSKFLRRASYALQGHVMEESARVATAARLPLPLCYPTAEEWAEIDALQTVLGRLVEEGVARFATGETPVDTDHLAAFEQCLRDAGADRLAAVWQDVVDRRWTLPR
jgi:hypothetical protein